MLIRSGPADYQRITIGGVKKHRLGAVRLKPKVMCLRFHDPNKLWIRPFRPQFVCTGVH